MSAPFVIPFNFCPSSTSIKTAAYTIPAGKYARVSSYSPNVTIDGVQIGEPVSWSYLDATQSPTTKLYTLDESAPIFIKTMSVTRSTVATGSTTISIQSDKIGTVGPDDYTVTRTSSIGTITSTINTLHKRNHLTLQTSGSSTGPVSHTWAITYDRLRISVESFWAPSGTVIGGTNPKFIIEEFNAIS